MLWIEKSLSTRCNVTATTTRRVINQCHTGHGCDGSFSFLCCSVVLWCYLHYCVVVSHTGLSKAIAPPTQHQGAMTTTARAGKQTPQQYSSLSSLQETSPLWLLQRQTSSVLSESGSVEMRSPPPPASAATGSGLRTLLWSIQILVGLAVLVCAMLQNGDEW